MKPEEQIEAIAKFCKVDEKYVLIKRSLYYRPCYRGYTDNINEAGKYTKEEAEQSVCLTAGEVSFERLPLPDYLNDLNEMHRAEKRLPASDRDTYWTYLTMIVNRERRMASTYWLCLNSTAAQRAEAFLKTLNLWNI